MDYAMSGQMFVEAARSTGCTHRQILWQVKLPLAIPEIMLGLNQTIMFALAMSVVAALVGTKGLGQTPISRWVQRIPEKTWWRGSARR